MVDYITSGDCDMARSGSKDATFAAVFGSGSSYGTGWNNLADFYAEFNAWLATNPDPASIKPTDAQVFQWMDRDHKGFIAPEDLQILSRLSSIDSPVLYAVNSACLCMFAVSGAQSGIHRGMHPLVCTVAGVTICFGGIIRDLLCQRDVAVGAESFAVSTGLGAGTYVALRELVLRGIAVPVELRIDESASAQKVDGSAFAFSNVFHLDDTLCLRNKEITPSAAAPVPSVPRDTAPPPRDACTCV